MSEKKTHPLGIFAVSTGMLDNWRALLPFFGQLVILNAEADKESNCIVYTALSDLFEEIEEGSDIPRYNIHVTMEEDETFTYTAEKQK